MENAVQITFRGMDHSDAIESRIRAKVAGLERFARAITSCRVTVEAPHQHHHKGALYDVRIDLRLPNVEIVVNREAHDDHAHEDVYVAIRDAFDAAGRQLEDHVRRQRGDVKLHDVPPHGKVTKLFRDDGYGFIETSDGTDVYFHRNAVAEGAFGALRVGEEVRLVVAAGEGERGPQASTVTRIGKHHPTGVDGR